MTTVVISSGHGKLIQGASSYINEVTEARKVVNQVAEYLKELGVTVYTFHDDTSTTQDTNLKTIVNYHNSKTRDLDISVHFNAASVTNDPRGVEVYHYNSNTKGKAASVSKAISNASGLKNRGAKESQSLYFLKNTSKPALLLEICFVDSKKDVELYQNSFYLICQDIAETIAGKELATKTSSIAIEGGKNYRLFTGTFPTKGEAEVMAAKIEAATGLQIKIREE